MSTAALRSRTPSIHVSYVGAVGRYIARRGLAPAPLYERFGWTAESVDEGQIRVPLADFFSLLDAAAEYVGDRHLGLHIYEHLDFADLGLLGFALLSAADVGSALRTLMRYGAIFQDCDDGQLLTERDYAYLFYRVNSSSLPPSRSAQGFGCMCWHCRISAWWTPAGSASPSRCFFSSTSPTR